MDYSYASGAVKAAEINLLDKSKLAKLFRCNDEEFAQTLVDMGYGVIDSTLEGVINSELTKAKKFLKNITPRDNVMDLFYLKNDAQNIKVIYKSKVFDLPHKNNFVDGVINVDSLLECILHDNYDKVPASYVTLMKGIAAKVGNVKNARVMSSRIDSCIFEFIFKQLETHKDKALKVYFETFINFANILTLVRCQVLNWGFDKFSEMFIENGSIHKDDFVSAYTLASESLVKHFIKKDYGEKISKGLKVYTDDMDLNHLEMYLDGLMLEIMKDYSIQFSTVGPLVYYYLEKQAEAKNIRMIYSNRETDVSSLLNY